MLFQQGLNCIFLITLHNWLESISHGGLGTQPLDRVLISSTKLFVNTAEMIMPSAEDFWVGIGQKCDPNAAIGSTSNQFAEPE